MKNITKKVMLLMFLLGITSFIHAQKTMIKGVVSDEDNTLPGCIIRIKGTLVEAESNWDGEYSLISKKGDVLIFTYLGYEIVEKTVRNSTVINVQMQKTVKKEKKYSKNRVEGKCLSGDCANGEGVFVDKKYKDKYKGEFKNGKKHGKGVLTSEDGKFKLDGLFVDGNFSKGTITDPDNGYSGEYSDGNYNGLGTLEYEDGSKYIGQFKNGNRHGKGKMIAIDGAETNGIYSNNVLQEKDTVGCSGDCENGEGTYIWKNGERYTGQWKNGERHGKGTYKWPFGDTYVGTWKEDNREGFGTYFSKGGNKHIGQWKDGKRNGKGTFVWKNGDKYIGQWEAGKCYVNGKLIKTDGTELVGIYEKGKFYKKSSGNNAVLTEVEIKKYSLAREKLYRLTTINKSKWLSVNEIKSKIDAKGSSQYIEMFLKYENELTEIEMSLSKSAKEFNKEYSAFKSENYLNNPKKLPSFVKVQKKKKEIKRVKNMLDLSETSMNLALTTYRMCKNNKYNKSNCQKEYNNYLKLYNNTTRLTGEVNTHINRYNTLIRYYEREDEKIRKENKIFMTRQKKLRFYYDSKYNKTKELRNDYVKKIFNIISQ